MGIRQSRVHPRGPPPLQTAVANNTHRDGSGNFSPNGSVGPGSPVYYADANPSPSDAEILQCLYTSRYEEHRGRVREPVEGTCTWVTKHPKYNDWLEQEKFSLLWLSGDPGCGKSVIASSLVKQLERRPGAIVCYFFFRDVREQDDSKEQNSAAFALCAILHQIFVQRKHLLRFAKEGFKAKGSKFTQEVDTLWNILVRVVAEGECGDVICVMDALDECEEGTQAQLIRLVAGLARSQNSKIPLKLLITSRPYHEIERGLCLLTPTIRLKGEEEIDAISADISRVIDDGVEELEIYWGRSGRLRYLRDLLQSRADRTFLWISLVLAELRGSEDYSEEELTRIVATTPHGLNEFYSRILGKIKSRNKAQRILEIVVAAARPLTLEEMNVAFRINNNHESIGDLEPFCPEFERTLKNLCGHFVRIIDSKIYLAHETARDFLLKELSSGQGWQHNLSSEESNHLLAEICINYLSLKEIKDDPLAMDSRGWISQEAVNEHLQRYAFLDYAARYWVDHFQNSQDLQMGLFDSTRQICETGSKRPPTWLQVYWLNNQGESGCPTDLTHLMIASWLGQRKVVEQLLEELEVDINARSDLWGTALNIAAVRKDEAMAKMLMEKSVNAYICSKEYNILHTKRSELHSSRPEDEEMIMFFKDYCVPDTPNPSASPNPGTMFSY